MQKYTTILNEQQLKGLLCIKAPVLILAGAGTGKTRVLTYKISYLIEEKDYSLNNILAVTFTNKASFEIKHRINNILNYNSYDKINWKWIGTFHSICLKIILTHFEKISLTQNFTIYDQSDTIQVIQKILKENPSLNKDDETGKNILYKISQYKNFLPYNVSERIQKDDPNLYQIYKIYENTLIQNNAIDFDNLILKTLLILKENKDILEYYQNHFKYILVDEFQDINIPQYELLKLLTKNNPDKITVVGDDDQSIYSWRGADSSKMQDFVKDYLNVLTIKLEQNYRSSNILLQAANSLISNNSFRIGKNLWSKNLEEEKIEYHQLENNQDEAMFVIRKIQNLKEKNQFSLKDFCILYRTNRQSRILEEMLIQKNIPYRIFGGFRFYERAEIKDILSFFSYMINPNNYIAFKRIIEISRIGIGLKSIEKIDVSILESDFSPKEALEYHIKKENLRKDIHAKFKNLLSLLLELEKIYTLHSNNLLLLLDNIIELINYKDYLSKKYPGDSDRISNIEELRISVANFQADYPDLSLENYLQDIALNLNKEENEDMENDFVSLMTLHNSKGLEFNYVFLCGLVDRILPHQNSIDEGNIEEERRLLYVGITRTKKKCFLIGYTKEINPFQKQGYYKSRFLDEINSDFLDKYPIIQNLNTNYKKRSHFFDRDINIQQSFNKKSSLIKKHLDIKKEKDQILSIKEIKIGQIIKHKDYGICKVLNIENADKNTGPVILVKLINGEAKISLFFDYNKFYFFKS